MTEAGGLSCLNTPLFPRGGKVDRTLRASYEKWKVWVTVENTQLFESDETRTQEEE